MKTTITFLICIVLFNNGIKAQTFQPDRIIYWVHGLAGNLHSWGPVANVTEFQSTPILGYPARNIKSAVMDYDDATASTLNGAALRVNNFMHALNITPDWNTIPTTEHFIIAHSQGGLVARTIDGLMYQNMPTPYNREFGGLVTFGTPHQGAQIINNTQPGGMLDQWLSEGCRILGYAEIQDFVSNNWIASVVLPPKTVEDIVGGACDILEQTILADLVNGIRLPLTQDYKVGAAHLNNLQNTGHSIPIVLFYGEEKDPVLWRTMASYSYSPTFLTNDPFGADADGNVLKTVNNYISKYRNRKAYHNKIAKQYNNAAWITGFTIIGGFTFASIARTHRGISRRYDEAQDWLTNANRNWEYIIGSRNNGWILDGYDCHCDGNLYFNTYWVGSPDECMGNNIWGNGECTASPIWIPNQTFKPNDGVVLTESAAVLPDAI